MKFQPDEHLGGNSISRYDADQVWINNAPHSQSVLVPWQGDVQHWPLNQFDALTPEHFEQMLPYKPELVIFGSGLKLRFAHPRLYRALMDAHIGIETMDLGAACRTYNVLASEGRSVLAALLIEA
jgi:uncharacterized protein